MPASRSGPAPEVRARLLEDWLHNARRDEEPWRTRFLSSIPAGVRAAIETAPRAGWLPVEMHVQLADLMEAAYGPQRAHEHYRRSFAHWARTGVVAPLVRSGLRLFGTTPAAFLRWANRGWDASFRHCGSLRGEVLGPRHGRLVYEDLPSVCMASDPWLGSAQGSAYGCYDLLEVTGVVRVAEIKKLEHRMELDLEWSERRP